MKLRYIKKEIWRYRNIEKKFMFEVHKWNESEVVHWNKYLYLFPGNSDFGKYLPDADRVFPETPFDWNYGITYYDEIYDKEGKMVYQQFGDDYDHIWDERDHSPLGEDGVRVFEDAEKFIKTLEEMYGNSNG